MDSSFGAELLCNHTNILIAHGMFAYDLSMSELSECDKELLCRQNEPFGSNLKQTLEQATSPLTNYSDT